ncbi:hypothetical protein Q7P37_006132 [Cladosporium fusiforme]
MEYTANQISSSKQLNTSLKRALSSDYSVSSGEMSQDLKGIDSPGIALPSSLGGRTFTTDNGSFPWRDVTILENGAPVHFADVSQFTRKIPDMVWHSGHKSGPIIGHTYMHCGPRSIKCGLGAEEATMKWFELKRSGFAHSKSYEVEWAGRSYVICRSNSGPKSGQYHVLDARTKEVVATHVSEFKFGSMRREKTLSFKPGVDEELQLLLIMGLSAWREKSRRTRNAANRQPY